MEDLSDNEIKNFANMTGMTPNRIKNAIQIRLNFSSVSLDTDPNDGGEDQTADADQLLFKRHCLLDEGYDPMDDIPDIEGTLNVIIQLTDDILDTDKKEYPQLFINHGLLLMLKDKQDDTEKSFHKTVKDVYLKREKDLYEKVFLYDYLLFVLRQPPQPDTIEQLDESEFKEGRKDRGKAIAEYKNVSESTVSRHFKEFNAAYLKITKLHLYG